MSKMFQEKTSGLNTRKKRLIEHVFWFQAVNRLILLQKSFIWNQLSWNK